MRSRMIAGMLICSACLCLTAARADDAQDDRRPITNQQFVHKASAGGLAEVAFGRMAAEKASSDEIRQFGRQMVQDHGKANQELTRIAEIKQLPIAREMDQAHKEMERKLMQLSGKDFDREYIQGQLKDHQEAVALFDKYSQSGTDKELKAFATQTLPTLKEHLAMVKQIADKIK
jgi:putative membrane protein